MARLAVRLSMRNLGEFWNNGGIDLLIRYNQIEAGCRREDRELKNENY